VEQNVHIARGQCVVPHIHVDGHNAAFHCDQFFPVRVARDQLGAGSQVHLIMVVVAQGAHPLHQRMGRLIDTQTPRTELSAPGGQERAVAGGQHPSADKPWPRSTGVPVEDAQDHPPAGVHVVGQTVAHGDVVQIRIIAVDDDHVIGEQVVQRRDRAPRVEPVHRGDVRIGHQLGGDGTEAVIGRDEQHPDPLGLLGGQRLRRRRCGQVRAHDQARMAEASVGRLR